MSAGGKPGVWVTLDDALVVALLAGLELVHQREDRLGRLDEGALPDQRDQEIELAVGFVERPLLAQQPVEQLAARPPVAAMSICG